MEIWKDIKGYEGSYQISNRGLVKSLNFNHTNKEKILKDKINRKGYRYVTLYCNSKAKYMSIHRLVAEAFILNPNNMPQVNHIDGNKGNNTVENLEWCTEKENVQHAIKTGLLKPYGSNNSRSVKIKQLDLNNNLLKIFNSISEAGSLLNIKGKPTGISKVCKGKRVTAYGYKWLYAK